MARIFIYRNGGITTTGIEGTAIPLSEGIKRYNSEKRKFCVDFSPIFKDKDKLFLVGNVYIPEVFTSVFYQYKDGREVNTSISCHGTSDDAIKLMEEIGSALEFKTCEPSKTFRQEVIDAHKPIELLWQNYMFEGRNNQKIAFATSLGIRQQMYRLEKARMN